MLVVLRVKEIPADSSGGIFFYANCLHFKMVKVIKLLAEPYIITGC